GGAPHGPSARRVQAALEVMGSDPHSLALVEPVGVSAFHTGIEIQEPAVGLVDSGEPESLGVLLRVDAFERRPGEMRPEFVSTGEEVREEPWVAGFEVNDPHGPDRSR